MSGAEVKWLTDDGFCWKCGGRGEYETTVRGRRIITVCTVPGCRDGNNPTPESTPEPKEQGE